MHACWMDPMFPKRTVQMSIAAAGYLTGYTGQYPFEKPGDLYGDTNYVGMRIVSGSITPRTMLSA